MNLRNHNLSMEYTEYLIQFPAEGRAQFSFSLDRLAF
jgi:hypothetical protein